MSAFKRQLKPGVILITKTGEVCVYLGYYKGSPQPLSMYPRPEEGYLYIYCGTIGMNLQNITQDVAWNLYRNNMVRLKSWIDGHAFYTKNPKDFECICKYTSEIPRNLNNFYPWGLQYVKEK